MLTLLQDVRFALRTLRRRRAFTTTAVLTIALGIGATTSIFGIVDGVLLRPLPFRDAGRLVQVRQVFTKWRTDPILNFMWDRIPFGVDEFEKLRDHNTVFQSIGIWSGSTRELTGQTTADRVRVVLASASLLTVLEQRPIRGRGIDPGEDVMGGPKVAIVGYDEWRRRFGGSDGVLGRSVVLDDVPYQIVGVLPPGLKLELRDSPSAYWIPVGQDSADRGHGNRSYNAVARLKPGVTLARAEVETRQILSEKNTVQGPKDARLADWHVEQTRDTRTPLFILLGAVGLLMVIACVNVATLMLGEATSREQEMAARVALGAGRSRLIRQLLTESLVLSLGGAAIGALLARWGTQALVAIAPPRIPGLGDVHVDPRVLLFAAAISVITGVLFGMAPALTLSRLPAASLIRGGGGQSAAGRGRLQRTFIALQLGLSVLLLVGAGLLSRSLLRLSAVDPGFRTDHLLLTRISIPRSFRDDSLATRAFYTRTVERIAALPGVAEATSANAVPFDGNSTSTRIELDGHPIPDGERGPEVQQRAVFPGYFAFMGIPLVAGRAFITSDRAGSEPVIVVSASLARRDFPNGSAVGQRVKFQGAWRTIIGVVRDVKFRGLSRDDEATVYAPFGQRSSYGGFLVRTTLPPTAVVGSLKSAIASLDSRVTVTSIDVMDDLVRTSFAEERFRTTLVSLFGIFAALLAAIGMYGVTTRAVARRTREVGIRVALGATPASVVGLIVRSTLGGVGIGVVCGVAAALIGARWVQGLLFQVDARDPVTYGGIVGFLGAVALIASWLPARRAARVHPAVVLRGE